MSWAQKFWVPLLVAGLAILGAFLIVATAPSTEYSEEARVLPTVRTIEATPTTVRYRVRSQGTVTPRTQADLIPEVSGRVVWKSPSLAAGGFFEEGATLLRLERRDFELAVTRQRSALQRAASERDFARSELERRERLSEAGVASPSQLGDARRTASVGEANWNDARAALEQAERDLARSEIKAPFAGRVREEKVDIGQFVTRGAVIARIYATDYAEVRLPIPDPQLAFLELPDARSSAQSSANQGPEVILRAVFAGRKHEWKGRVVRTEGEIDERSRMVHVVARVDDPYRIEEGGDRPPLAVGLFVEAEILGPEAENVIVVPRYAMRDDSKILVVDAQSKLRTRTVDVLRIERDQVLVKGPLADGERICVSPLQVVVEGMSVQIVEDPPESPVEPPAQARAGKGVPAS